MQVEVTEGREDETAFRELYNVRKVLVSVRTEADDESVTVNV